MQKHIYTIVLFTTIFCLKGFSQALPPIINSYADSVGNDYCNLYISFSPNDTGKIMANIVIQQGQGDGVFDSTFTLPAGDTANVEFEIDSLTPCTQYQVLTIMSNDTVIGLQSNPLVQFTTLCTSGIIALNENTYSLIALSKSVELKTGELPQNGMIEIFDMTGRLILTTPFTQPVQQIPFNQNAGIYLLRVTGNGQPLYTNRFAIF